MSSSSAQDYKKMRFLVSSFWLADRFAFRVSRAHPDGVKSATHKMDRKRIRKTLMCLSAAIIAVVLAFEFMPELFGIAWHLRNGRTAHIGSYDVDPPIFWITTSIEGNREVHSVKKPPIRRAFGEWGLMSFSADPMYSTASQMRKEVPKRAERLQTTEIAHMSVAGQEIACFDERQVSNPNDALAKEQRSVKVTCVPENDERAFSASFMGSPGLLPVFYNAVKSVRKRP